MNTQLNVPSEIKIGQVKRNDTYTGRLGYVIYKDEKKKWRKEVSWEGWRDKSIDPIFADNVPTEGFVLNRHGGGNSHSSYSDYYSRAAFIRVYDPRDFEFEISLENLLFILKYADCSRGKGLEGKFVYAWNGKDLVLLPEECQEYKDSVEFTSLKTMKVASKELVPGYTYLTKNQENVVYLGKYMTFYGSHRYNMDLANRHVFIKKTDMVSLEEYMINNNWGPDDIEKMRQEYSEKYIDTTYYWNQTNYSPEIFEEYNISRKNNLMKSYNNYVFISLEPSKLAKVLDTNVHHELAEYISKLENSSYIFLQKNLEVEKFTLLEETYHNSYTGRHTHSFFIKINDNQYNKVNTYINEIYEINEHQNGNWNRYDKKYRPSSYKMVIDHELTIYDDNIVLKECKDKAGKIISSEDLKKLDSVILFSTINGNKTKIN